MSSCIYHASVNDHTVGVYALKSGRYLGAYGLKAVYDPWNTTTKSESFDNIEDAYRFIGWPVDILPLPKGVHA